MWDTETLAILLLSNILLDSLSDWRERLMSDRLTAAVVAPILRRLNRTYFFSRQINKQTNKQASKQTNEYRYIRLESCNTPVLQYMVFIWYTLEIWYWHHWESEWRLWLDWHDPISGHCLLIQSIWPAVLILLFSTVPKVDFRQKIFNVGSAFVISDMTLDIWNVIKKTFGKRWKYYFLTDLPPYIIVFPTN